MKITKPETLENAIANMRLEGLSLPPDVEAALQIAIRQKNADTDEILKILLEYHKKE